MVSIEIDLIESNKSKWDKVELSTWQRGALENRGENWIEMIENWLNLPNSKCVPRKEPREWEKDRGGEWSMYGWNFSMFYQQKPAMGRQKTNRRKLHIFSTYPHFIVYLKDYRCYLSSNTLLKQNWVVKCRLCSVGKSLDLIFFAEGIFMCIVCTVLEKRNGCCVVPKNIHSNMITDRLLSTLTRKKVSQLVSTCVRAAQQNLPCILFLDSHRKFKWRIKKSI